MSQPTITLSDGLTLLTLDPDLLWADEFEWFSVEQTVDRGLTGALIIDVATRQKGRPITLMPPADDSAWMRRAVVTQLRVWESNPTLTLTLDLRGESFSVVFRRHDGAPIEARAVEFVADPLPGDFGDWFLVTLRLIEV